MKLSFLFASLVSASTVFAQNISNLPIDLIVPAAAEPQTDPYLFDETSLFLPNFSINQNDPTLKDLFSDRGVSNLCFPTSFAEALIALYGYHSPKFDRLQFAGLSEDHHVADPNALVRQLASLCQTDRNTGTDAEPAISCVSSVFKQSGYALGGTKLITPFSPPSVAPPIESREVTIQDLREALDGKAPVLLEVGWFRIDPATKTWTRDSGHYVTVFGYDYNRAWGENQIQLKIVNPETNYGPLRSVIHYDTITIERYSPQAGVIYPPHRPFIVSGAGFGGSILRAYVGQILILDPKEN